MGAWWWLPVLLAGCVTQPKWDSVPTRVRTQVFDEHGNEVAEGEAGQRYRILGLGPGNPDALADPFQEQDLTPQEEQRRREAAIRNTFGPTVLIRGDLVTKRYFLGAETREIFKQLVGNKVPPPGQTQAVGGKGDRVSIMGAMLGEDEVEISYLENFERVPVLFAGDLPVKQGPMIPVGIKQQKGQELESTTDLLLVTAKAPQLSAFERALNLFFSNIPQVEIEVKVVEFGTSQSFSFGVADSNIPTFTNLKSSRLVQEISSAFPLTPPLGSGIESKGTLTLGGIHDGWELSAKLELLEATGKADVLSNPRLMVRNGGTAAIATFTEFPFPKASFSGNVTSADVAFRPVGITLGIKPIIAGTETVILQIHADYSAVTGFAGTDPIPTPVVSTRTALTSVHVPNGKTTIIGGLRIRTSFENEAKIPILGDIPILGYLFRSTTTQDEEAEVKFFITPHIRIGSQDVLAR